jgi:RNA recognition motif-containing protein
LAEAGTITRVAIAEVDGKRRGFCHVEFSTVEEAKSAIEKFNGQELDGRTLSMDLARKRGAAGGSRACYKCN